MMIKSPIIILASAVSVYVLSSVVTTSSTMKKKSENNEVNRPMLADHVAYADLGSSPRLVLPSISETEQKPTDQQLASINYKDSQNYELLSDEEILDIFELNKLSSEENRGLTLNHDNKVILENLFRMLSSEEIRKYKNRLVDAIAGDHGDRVADEFLVLMNQFDSYLQRMRAIDAERNAIGFEAEQAASEVDIKSMLQDEAFGYENAEKLFGLERRIEEMLTSHLSEPSVTWDQMAEKDRLALTQELYSIPGVEPEAIDPYGLLLP